MPARIKRRWRDSGGKHRQKTFPSNTPISVINEVMSQIRAMDGAKPQQVHTLKDFCLYWLTERAPIRQKSSTRLTSHAIIRKHIIPYFSDILLTEVRPTICASFQSHLASQYKPQTVNNIFSVFSNILREATALEFIPKNPVLNIRAVPTPKSDRDLPKYYTFEQLDLFLSAARELNYDVFIATMLSSVSGMRIGELRALQPKKIDFIERQIDISATWIYKESRLQPWCKHHTDRTVQIPEAALDIVRIHCQNLQKDDHLFPYLCNSWPINKIEPICEAIGIPYYGMHVFRHTFATHLAMHKRPAELIMKVMGHRKIDMTMKYIHLANDYIKTQGVTDALTQNMAWASSAKKKLTVVRDIRH